MTSGKMIAVWGSPGSGKSVVAAKLARRLVEQSRSTVLLFCDTLAPMLPCVCAPRELEQERSLGSVFAAAQVSERLVRNNLTTLKASERLSLLGFLRGENAWSYPQCSEQLAAELLTTLRGIADCVVVDCSSYIDALTLAALERADTVLRLVSAELKSVSYFASTLPLVPNANSHVRVANSPRPLRTWERVGQRLSETAFRLPYSSELERQYSDGALLSELRSRDGKVFLRETDKIIQISEV